MALIKKETATPDTHDVQNKHAAAEALKAAAEKQQAAQAAEPAATPEPAAETKAVATTRPAGGNVPVLASAVMKNMLFADMENTFVADFGTLPRLKASNGNVLDQDGAVLGAWVDGMILSWNYRYTISPGDDKAPNALARFSLDNETLDDGSGTTVREYLAELKKDWPEASSKKGAELIIELQGSDRPTPYIGMMVQMQLAPSSLKVFDNFRLQQTFQIARKRVSVEQAQFVRFKADIVPKNSKGHSWTKFTMEMAQPVA